MKPGDALRELERLLKARGATSSKVSVRDGIEAMLDFYRNTRADDCSLDDDGDMLLFQWGTSDWGKGPEFDLGITRQFIRGDGGRRHLAAVANVLLSAERDRGGKSLVS
jgi:hypothetical protein